MKIYAMSDIHGCLDAFERALGAVDLDGGDSMLVLLGDYCDRGPDSLGVLERAMGLQERYGDRVVALRGNHEEMLLEYVDGAAGPGSARAWMLADADLATARSFLSARDFEHVSSLLQRRGFDEAYRFAVGRMRAEHGDVIEWVGGLPYYYESPFGQLFVHAGIDEEAGDLWRTATPAEWFTGMLPEYAGRRFRLDVVAGHIGTAEVSGNPGYRGIWFDGFSHYYIDADVVRHGELAVLEYDSATGRYAGPGLDGLRPAP